MDLNEKKKNRICFDISSQIMFLIRIDLFFAKFFKINLILVNKKILLMTFAKSNKINKTVSTKSYIINIYIQYDQHF